MADYAVGQVPVEVVPDAGCRAQVVVAGGRVYYGPSRFLDPTTMIGGLGDTERITLDSPMWFMSAEGSRIHVVQQRFCRKCGWVDDGSAL